MNEEQKFLSEYNFNEYEKPSVAADMAVFTIMKEEVSKEDCRKLPEKKLKLLMIKRGNPPYKDLWALPGGFLKKGETIYETARRELKEETGARNAYLELCNVFSEKDRDPRGWIISQAFMALVNTDETQENTQKIRAGSDAKEAEWFEIRLEKKEETNTVMSETEMQFDILYELNMVSQEIRLNATVAEHKVYQDYHELVEYKIINSEGIAFDHAKIITCILNRLRKNVETDAKMAFDLMPEYFTLTDFQSAVEIILDKQLVKPNFRRKIADYVIKTDEMVMDGGHRPSYLYKRNVKSFYGQ